MEKRLDRLDEKVDTILGNHLPHLGAAIEAVKTDMSSIKTDVSWLKKFFWIIASSSLGGLFTGLANLIFHR